MEQYNFKIESELKERAEELGKNEENKAVFLKKMLDSFELQNSTVNRLTIDEVQFDKQLVAQAQNLLESIFSTIKVSQNRHNSAILELENEKETVNEKINDLNKKLVENAEKTKELEKEVEAKNTENETLKMELEEAKLKNEQVFSIIKKFNDLESKLLKREKEMESLIKELKEENLKLKNVKLKM